MGFYSSQVLFFHIAEEILDGQSGHLDGGCGVHDCHSTLDTLSKEAAVLGKASVHLKRLLD